MDVLKGLLKSGLVISALVLLGVVTSIVINAQLTGQMATAYEDNYKEGQAAGYETGFHNGSQTGYQAGSKSGFLKGSQQEYDNRYVSGFYFTYNPSYEEMRQFLVESRVSSASEIHAAAEANGIRVAYVRCQIARQATTAMGYVYNLIAFDTVDRGFVIIEPWSYREVTLETEKSYSQLNGFPPPDYDDTITQVNIVW